MWEMSDAEIAVIKDLLEAYLVDGTHPVDAQAAEALQTRLLG